VVVDSVDFRVVVSPDGETVVLLVVLWVLSVIPLLVSVVRLLLELLPPYTGAGGVIVDWVDVVVEDEVCARATPVIIAMAVVATRKDLIMSCSPWNRLQTEIACCPVEGYDRRNGVSWTLPDRGVRSCKSGLLQARRGECGQARLPTIAQGLYLNSGRPFSESLVAPGSTIFWSFTTSEL